MQTRQVPFTFLGLSWQCEAMLLWAWQEDESGVASEEQNDACFQSSPYPANISGSQDQTGT